MNVSGLGIVLLGLPPASMSLVQSNLQGGPNRGP